MTRSSQAYVDGPEPDGGGHFLGAAAGDFGRGLLAGLLGTAAMTAAQRIQLEIEDREPSTEPADAVKKIFGIHTRDEAAEQRLAQAAHWGYGVAWGGVRGLLKTAGLGPVAGSLAHFLLVWAAEIVVLPALGVSEPVTEWEPAQLARDAGHHAVYAAATGAAFTWLDR